jgi:DnaJ-class molecular chaperone
VSEVDELAPLRRAIDTLYAGLDHLPYHVFLGVREDAQGDVLRMAFHVCAERYHPDRFYALEDQELKAKVYAVYKRITEAYRVLCDPEARKLYEEQRQRGGVRLDRSARPTGGPKRQEDQITNPTAKKYFLMAMDAERRGDLRSAKLNVQLALQLEPSCAMLQQKWETLK